MTPKEWREAEALWASGTVTIVDLAKKFNRHRMTFMNHFKKKGIKKGSKADKIAEKAHARMEKEAENDAAIIAARIRETKDDHYKMAAGLAKLTWAEILKAKQDGVALGTIQMNLKSLDIAMSALKKAREERYSVLGLDRPDAVDENDVPELVISELTAEQIEMLRSRNFRDVDDDLESLDLPGVEDEAEGAPENANDDEDGIVEENE